MGVLQRSPACIAVSNQNQFLLDDFQRALPDFRAEDNVGSVFSDQRYLACAVVRVARQPSFENSRPLVLGTGRGQGDCRG